MLETFYNKSLAKESISFYSLWLIEESCQDPNKIKKNRNYPPRNIADPMVIFDENLI